MFAALQRETAGHAGCDAVEALVRARLVLAPEVTVAVVERPTTLPGCPPWETVVDFWLDQADGSTLRHHCKVFKRAAEVLADDLPPYWMKAALAVPAHFVCSCC